MHYWWAHYNVYCIAPSICVRGVFVSDSGDCAKKQALFILIPPVFWCTCLFSLFENECDKRFDFLSLDLSVIFCWHDYSESFWRIDSLRQNLRPFLAFFLFRPCVSLSSCELIQLSKSCGDDFVCRINRTHKGPQLVLDQVKLIRIRLFPSGNYTGVECFQIICHDCSVAKYLSHQSNYLMKTTPGSFLWPLTQLIPLFLLFSGNFPRSINRGFTRRQTQLHRRLGSPTLCILIILPCVLSRTRTCPSVAAATRSGSADVRWLLQGHRCGLRVRWCVLRLLSVDWHRRTKWPSPLLFASHLSLLDVFFFFNKIGLFINLLFS